MLSRLVGLPKESNKGTTSVLSAAEGGAHEFGSLLYRPNSGPFGAAHQDLERRNLPPNLGSRN